MSPSSLVLVVDDDPDVLEAMNFALEDAGYDVAAATNGGEALQRLRSGPRPCLIILDLMMPIMNGWEFRAAQRCDPGLAGIPLVVLTGAGRTASWASLEDTPVLEKPIALTALLATVEHYCGPCPGGLVP